MQGMKRCPICGVTKPLTEYHRYRDGYQSYCKICRRAYNRSSVRKLTPNQVEREATKKSRSELAGVLAKLRDKHKMSY